MFIKGCLMREKIKKLNKKSKNNFIKCIVYILFMAIGTPIATLALVLYYGKNFLSNTFWIIFFILFMILLCSIEVLGCPILINLMLDSIIEKQEESESE